MGNEVEATVTNLQQRWSDLPPRIRGFLTWLGVFAGLVLLKRNALLLPASWDESWAALPGGLWRGEQLRRGRPAARAAVVSDWTGHLRAITGHVDDRDHCFATTTPPSFLISPTSSTWRSVPSAFARYTVSPDQFGPLGRYRTRCGRTAIVPVMNAQLGFMYLETPIFAVGMLAINAALSGDWTRAALWGALAT